MDYSEKRIDLLNWIYKQLVGPVSDENPIRIVSPLKQYQTGILFPITRGEQGLDTIVEEQNEKISSEEEKNYADSSQKRRYYIPPSSVGFSFFIAGVNIEFELEFKAVRYEKASGRDEYGQFKKNEWNRIQLYDQ